MNVILDGTSLSKLLQQWLDSGPASYGLRGETEDVLADIRRQEDLAKGQDLMVKGVPAPPPGVYSHWPRYPSAPDPNAPDPNASAYTDPMRDPDTQDLVAARIMKLLAEKFNVPPEMVDRTSFEGRLAEDFVSLTERTFLKNPETEPRGILGDLPVDSFGFKVVENGDHSFGFKVAENQGLPAEPPRSLWDEVESLKVDRRPSDEQLRGARSLNIPVVWPEGVSLLQFETPKDWPDIELKGQGEILLGRTDWFTAQAYWVLHRLPVDVQTLMDRTVFAFRTYLPREMFLGKIGFDLSLLDFDLEVAWPEGGAAMETTVSMEHLRKTLDGLEMKTSFVRRCANVLYQGLEA